MIAYRRKSKKAALARLARDRRMASWPGYSGVGDYHGGVYECHYVSPYTKGANNVDSKIFVMLQDWSSDLSLRGAFDPHAQLLGHTPSEPTNKNLARLLCQHFSLSLGDVYATNLFPFIKPGMMSERIPPQHLKRAAIEYAIPQVEIVLPSLVICLGLATFNAMRKARNLRSVDNITIASESVFELSGAKVWCQAHTGALGQRTRNRGGINRVHDDWARMARAFDGCV